MPSSLFDSVFSDLSLSIGSSIIAELRVIFYLLRRFISTHLDVVLIQALKYLLASFILTIDLLRLGEVCHALL